MQNQADKIKQLQKVKKGIHDREIGSLLGLARASVAVYRSRFNIKANKGKGRPQKAHMRLKRIICSMLNKEHPQYPLSDNKIIRNLNKIGVIVSKYPIITLRHKLGIPPAFSIPKTSLNRKQLYFQEGRYVWRTDGKHSRKS